MTSTISGIKAVKLEELEDSGRECTSCRHLSVCWLVPSVKNALAGHEQQTGVVMFKWEAMAEICSKYDSFGMQVSVDNNLM